jgi:hypothetical protein
MRLVVAGNFCRSTPVPTLSPFIRITHLLEKRIGRRPIHFYTVRFLIRRQSLATCAVLAASYRIGG